MKRKFYFYFEFFKYKNIFKTKKYKLIFGFSGFYVFLFKYFIINNHKLKRKIKILII